MKIVAVVFMGVFPLLLHAQIHIASPAQKENPKPKAGLSEHLLKKIQSNMVDIQGGTFRMGSLEQDEERPVHSVTLSSFAISKYEVTVEEFSFFLSETGYAFKDIQGEGTQAVVGVSWNDAVAYCGWLSRKTGKAYRLPTEAEWEYAARGGSQSRGYLYSGSNEITSVAWFDSNSGKGTHPVGEKIPNELGIYDMTGNAWEWCSDRYGDYSADLETNPKGASEGLNRVLRGGSWTHTAEYCRVAYRFSETPDFRDDDGGFRVVVSE